MKSVGILIVFFLLSTAWLYYLTTYFHSKTGGEMKFPHNLDNLKVLAKQLQQYKEENYMLVMVLFCSAYLYKQTFAIPGSVFMNLLAGALFDTPVGFPLVCLLTAIGASGCYTLSKMFGKGLLVRYFPEKIASIESKVEENRDHLFYFLLSARLFPFSPNWAMNMILPIIGVSRSHFFFSVLFGLMPYNFICVQTGSILTYVDSVNDMFSTTTLLGMFFIAVVAVLPGLVMKNRTPPTKPLPTVATGTAKRD